MRVYGEYEDGNVGATPGLRAEPGNYGKRNYAVKRPSWLVERTTLTPP